MLKASKSSSAPIYLRLMGGLGNQLFQYAAGRSLADTLGVELVIDDRYLVRKFQHTGLAIDAFNIRARLMEEGEKNLFSETKVRFSRWLKRALRPLANVFWETQFNYDHSLKRLNGGCLLSGFWQSERYINDAPQIRLDLTLKNCLGPGALKAKNDIISCESVAVHVRRGDYLQNQKTIERYGVCGESYYQNAINKILTLHPKSRFFIFSDDTNWVRSHLTLPSDSAFVSASNISAVEDLVLMSQCKHQIIANSTFSWWGAWLNNHQQKIVIAPTPWFDDSGIASEDLIPKGWHQLNKANN